ncbi:MAG: gfo/Idh/MocA family oxidoreductase [Deltaproteobacteria bacterium]|nr:MAG: gfo/Idh/MocA family oxidoreductase [Deltaproteobacteria bacterium]
MRRRLLVVGCGRWGQNVLRTLGTLPGVTVAAVVDPSEAARRRALRLWPGARGFSHLGDALASARVDGAVVAAPPRLHGALLGLCVDAGLPCYVEKILSVDPQEARSLVARATAPVMVGLCTRHHVAHVTLAAHRERIGTIRHVAAVRASHGLGRHGVDVLWDLGPHDLAALMALFEPRPIGARVRHRIEAHGLTLAATLRVDFPGGRGADLRWSWLEDRPQRRWWVTGHCGTATIDEQDPTLPLQIRSAGPCAEAVPLPPFEPPLTAALRRFLGAEDHVDVEEGLAIVDILHRLSPLVPEGSARDAGVPARALRAQSHAALSPSPDRR